jgi:hypothetical protein
VALRDAGPRLRHRRRPQLCKSKKSHSSYQMACG